MPEKPLIRIDVRSLAEILFMEGDLGVASPAGDSGAEGLKAHRKLQERGIPGYRAEVPLALRLEGRKVDLELSGRADGIYEMEGLSHIEEIKTNLLPQEELRPDPVHLAQLGLYGWISCRSGGAAEIALDLLYVHRKSGQTRSFSSVEAAEALEERYGPPLAAYLAGLDAEEGRRRSLSAGIAALGFPFPDFRLGQREAAEGVYRAIRDGSILFLQAPTGIGKTMAVLFPALKALGAGSGSKIFFLTAKNSGAASAEKALERLSAALPGLRWISVTAKGRICFLREGPETDNRFRPPCHPELCPYARGYFSKARTALEGLLGTEGGEGRFDRERIEKAAREGELCPFELSLDLSLSCDVVVGDYNYAFDPGSRLKRYFSNGKTDFVFLIDEAHNLVDRARAMHSARLSKRRVLEARRTAAPTEKKLLSRLNASLLAAAKNSAAATGSVPGEEISKRFPLGLDGDVESVVNGLERILGSGEPLSPAALDLYWELKRTLRVLSCYDETYRTIASPGPGGFSLDFLCADPSARLRDVLDEQRAAVFFSGTLSPASYFKELLAPDMESRFLDLPSPFPPENCAYLIQSGVSTKWKAREANAGLYAEIVREAFEAVPGNLIVFSPSFAFQNALLSRLCPSGDLPPSWIVQSARMGNTEKEAFLAAFDGEGVRAFAVAGGSFSESVDLEGEKLVGAVVFGVGLPQVNASNEAIREYFESKRGKGYAWAYLYPGLTRVLQAAGRVIRSESDRGFVLLADERYATAEYLRLLPERWEARLLRPGEDFARALPEGVGRREKPS